MQRVTESDLVRKGRGISALAANIFDFVRDGSLVICSIEPSLGARVRLDQDGRCR